ncbi:hypothetical protein Q8A73_006205 [Channa argus]|nr:hypothetical protein Q8A73_006205 [Channa argus]
MWLSLIGDFPGSGVFIQIQVKYQHLQRSYCWHGAPATTFINPHLSSSSSSSADARADRATNLCQGLVEPGFPSCSAVPKGACAMAARQV